MYQRRRAPGIGLLFLISQLHNIGFNRIPPVTLSVIAINIAVYLRLLNSLPGLASACVSANHVWFNNDWKRLIVAVFYHLDDFHLYYNMASFVWKGMSLERAFGSAQFLYVLSTFAVMTNAVLVGLDILLANITGNASYLYTCAAGFSGVIFALKILTTYNLPSGVTRVMGFFQVPMRWACWVELLLIQLIVPNASFTGHLAGILVGLMYIKGPLKYLIDTVWSITSSTITARSGPSYTYQAETTGRKQNAQREAQRSHAPDTDFDDQGLQQAIRASLQETQHTPNSDDQDPHLQSAIRQSLHNYEGVHVRESNEGRPYRDKASSRFSPYTSHQRESYPRSCNPRTNHPNNLSFGKPPSYSDAERLFPRLLNTPVSGASPPHPGESESLYPTFPEPSAPPAEMFSESQQDSPLPYPTESRMPMPSSLDNTHRRPLDTVDEIRRRRLERFER